MIRYIRNISVPEESLIEAIRELGFGEVYGATIPTGKFTQLAELSEPEWKLVNYLRTGVSYIDCLSVHAGSPAIAETNFIIRDLKVRKKVKFSIS